MESPSATLVRWTGRLRRPVVPRAQEAAVPPIPSQTSHPSHESYRSHKSHASVRLRLLLPLALFLFPFALLQGCGLDWTLPRAHFEGVDEQGYVSYWEKIGEADLGDGLVIPVHLNFNSHRESSSPTLGKGWMLPLLESHVEPVDENTLHVIMPDGWTFLFLRNGNTDTWRGNADWIGQTDGARFTATAPCGWQVKFDAGKIQEIDTPKNRTISIKYNGPAPVEADIDNQPFFQVAQNTATGVAESITIAGQKIAITQAQRPRISTVLGKTLLTGFDPALSQLQWPDGQKETFNFAAPQDLTPSMVVTRPNQHSRDMTWDATTMQVKTDGDWTYAITAPGGAYGGTLLSRKIRWNQAESFLRTSDGETKEVYLDGSQKIVYAFVNGPLRGRIRKIITVSSSGQAQVIYSAVYDPDGFLVREQKDGLTLLYKRLPDNKGSAIDIYDGKNLLLCHREYSEKGFLIKTSDDMAQGTNSLFEDISKNLRLSKSISN